MKKVSLAVFIVMLVIGSISCIAFKTYKTSYNENKQQAEDVLRIAQHMVDAPEIKNDNVKSDEDLNEDETTDEASNFKKTENDIIGILIIDKLNIEAPIKEDTSQEIMKTSVGHFLESDLWNGNVSFASHNSGTSMHYFQDIHKLEINDEIKYKTKFGEKIYKVQSIQKIRDTDWSMVVKNNDQTKGSENTITLITCINGQPNYRLCVRGIEI